MATEEVESWLGALIAKHIAVIATSIVTAVTSVHLYLKNFKVEMRQRITGTRQDIDKELITIKADVKRNEDDIQKLVLVMNEQANNLRHHMEDLHELKGTLAVTSDKIEKLGVEINNTWRSIIHEISGRRMPFGDVERGDPR